MKKQIRAIAAVAAATMLLLDALHTSRTTPQNRHLRHRLKAAPLRLLVQRRHRQGKTGRCLTIFQSGQKEQ